MTSARRSAGHTGNAAAASAHRGTLRALVFRALSASLAVVAGLTLGLCASADAAGGEAEGSPLPVSVAIDMLAPGPAVPARFLGLSFEAAALNQLAQYSHRGDLVPLLRSLGPGVLRFGGITADENVAWSDAATPRPAWAKSVIGPEQMRAIGELAHRSGWQVLLTVGLAHDEPLAAAREVASARSYLGRYLAAVEVGNEPDAYGKHGLRGLPWIAQGYEEEVTSYREAIAALAPGVQIAGPDVSGSGIFPEWGEEEALAQHPALLTGHHYPLGCAQTPAPSIETLLSPAVRGREAVSLGIYMNVARSRGIPLRIDESNSVSCGGVAGISDTFASSLWASAYITQAMAAGAAGINLQGNPTNCTGYTPVCAPDPTALAAGSLLAEPDWYALLLTRSLVGERPLPSSFSASAPPNLVTAAFAGPHRSLQVVLVDDEPPGSRALALRLSVGGEMGAGRLLRLDAPSPSATAGVLLGGRAVAADGSWRAPMHTEGAATHAGITAVELMPSSAALLTVTPSTALLRRHARVRRG